MSTTDELFHSGLKSYQAGELSEAALSFEQVLAIEPYSSEAMLNLGNVYFKQGNAQKAEELWRKAIEFNPVEEKAYLNLGKLFYSQQKFEEAIVYWETFKSFGASNADVHYNLGLAYEAVGRMHRALNAFQKFMLLKGRGLDALHLKRRLDESARIAEHNVRQAEKYLRMGQIDNAKIAYEGVVKVYPAQPKVYKHYASILYQLGEYAQALHWYEEAYSQNTKDTQVLMNLGILYDRLNQPFLAFWAYSEAIRADDSAPYRIKKRCAQMWEEHGTSLIDSAMDKIRKQLGKGNALKAEKLYKRLQTIVVQAAPDRRPELEALNAQIVDRKNPKQLAAKLAFALAEDCRAKGQYEHALQCYDRYRELMPKGEKVAEVKEKQDQLRKSIAAVISTVMADEQGAA